MRKYSVYVDQSGKVENLSSHTGIAYSDESGKDFSNAVFIDKNHKKRLKDKAKNNLGNISEYRVKLFGAGIFMFIQNDIHRLREVRVDQEYEGKLAQIKHHLWNFLNNNTDFSSRNYPELKTCILENEINNPSCDSLAYKAMNRDLEDFLKSDYKFLKALILRTNN
ncbi:hypothetical protein GLU64_00750 [Nanohaloarchaea archaeon]|nr:hypothetical protein [Candidatus Nanohaloarchaea archaeon]